MQPRPTLCPMLVRQPRNPARGGRGLSKPKTGRTQPAPAVRRRARGNAPACLQRFGAASRAPPPCSSQRGS
eukprot:2366351-Alexandrium_andersonii.AAC.1